MSRILQPEILIFLIPIVAIICRYAYKSAELKCEHEERLAKIEAGIDPDA